MDYLPLDIRYLPLRDALAYSQVCTVAFDAVYYVFAHRDELDFRHCWMKITPLLCQITRFWEYYMLTPVQV